MEIQLIRASIRELATALETLVQFASSSPADPLSAAKRHQDSKFNLVSLAPSTVLSDAHMAILFATVSGADHVRAYVSLLKKTRSTTSLATLTRGALEAFAKAGYLLTPAESPEFIGRYIDVTQREFFHPLKHSRFLDHTGAEIEKTAYPTRLGEIRAALDPAPPRPEKIAKTKQQVDLLLESALLPGADASLLVANIYSQLSGAAHAGTSALGMYAGAERDPLRFIYPREIALEHVAYTFSAIARVGELAVSHFRIPGQQLEGWASVLNRSGASLLRLQQTAEE